MPWTVETRGAIVDAEIAALPKATQAAFLRLAERIEAIGLERVGHPLTLGISGTNSGRCGSADGTASPGRSPSPPWAVGSLWCMPS